MKSLVIGLAGTRGAGKDTLYHHMAELNPTLVRTAFADRLKSDLGDLIEEQFGYLPETLTPAQKEVVRPLYIGYGMAWRAADPLHWVKAVIQQIDAMPDYVVPVNCDHRFVNEAQAFRNRYGAAFKLVQINRKGAPLPTEEEQKHWVEVASMADYTVNWGNDTVEEQRQHARTLLGWLGR